MAEPVATAPAAPAAAPAPVAAAPTPAAPAAAPATAPASAPAAAPAADDLVDLFAEKPAEVVEKTDEEKTAEAAATATALAESYELKLPDGLELPEETLSGVKAKLAAANVPADQAQALFDEYVGAAKTAGEAAAKAGQDAWTNTQKEWQAAIKADPDIGGAKLEGAIASTRKGAEALLGEGAKEFFTALNITGAGNNPAIVKAMHKAFSIHAPAETVTGTTPATKQQRSAGSVLYPTQAGLGNANLN